MSNRHEIENTPAGELLIEEFVSSSRDLVSGKVRAGRCKKQESEDAQRRRLFSLYWLAAWHQRRLISFSVNDLRGTIFPSAKIK